MAYYRPSSCCVSLFEMVHRDDSIALSWIPTTILGRGPHLHWAPLYSPIVDFLTAEAFPRLSASPRLGGEFLPPVVSSVSASSRAMSMGGRGREAQPQPARP
ncbi:hypothetical protein NDU88_001453 [Pleurodeles waltl]|uniref:Uncharacterized protein n=1 Tax=Pleurodeles waltl TaxID=8319 RepID=A0AAV7WLT3_PLEWA|nr:hypothetical protein NDU88_001453 [Pleurodeles waltl]